MSISFAQKGAKVWALGLQTDKAVYPAGLDIETVEMDVTDKTAVDQFFSNSIALIPYSMVQAWDLFLNMSWTPIEKYLK